MPNFFTDRMSVFQILYSKKNGLPKSIARCTTSLTLFARSARGFLWGDDILNAKGV